MDGTTEPIIAVIAHPIAGNPSQFAVERALRSLELDWRVLSFDVKPEDIAAALEGFSVTGISGVIIDPSVTDAAARWYALKMKSDLLNDPAAGAAESSGDLAVPADATIPSEPASEHGSDGSKESDAPQSDPSSPERETSAGDSVRIDCLYREQPDVFLGSYEQRAWVDQQIEQHAGENRIWFGQSLADAPLSPNGWAEDPLPSPPSPETIRAADVIVITGDGDDNVVLECEDWPQDDGSTLVVDLTDGHPEQAMMQQLGYRVLTELERRIGTLQRCLRRWTGEDCSAEVIHDAIEEYLGV